MAGIYIHVPFCRQACHYCDFHFSTSLKNKAAFLTALNKEIKFQKEYLGNETISTIYFGGGTPSLLSKNEIVGIFDELNNYFTIDRDAEITLEANPDDLTKSKLKELKQTPVNRLSIGIQSFFDEDLKWMNRAHSSHEAITSVQSSQEIGFTNINVDLIYGLPTLSDERWIKNLQTVFELPVQHVSAYCLTVEPGTALAYSIKSGKTKNVNEDQSSDHFGILLYEMNKNGFIQYEISNFGKENFYSKHNSNYWLKKRYLGLGPSAHSYNGNSRRWNVANNNKYIQSIEKKQVYFEEETLSPQNNYNEYVMTSLRTIWGIDLNYIKNNFSDSFSLFFIREAKKHIDNNHLLQADNKFFLTAAGKLFADKIASDLFVV